MAIVWFTRSSFFSALGWAGIALLGAPAAAARPAVSASIAQCMLVQAARSTQCSRLPAGTTLSAGTVIRYTIVATNSGNEAVFDVRPAGKIPPGTAYKPNSAVSAVAAARPRFSVDGGTTWSNRPAAGGAPDTTIGWFDPAPLGPRRTTTFRYDVTVK